MAQGFKYDIVNGQIVITDGMSTEVLGKFLTGKSRVASTVEEGDMLHAQANVVSQACAQETPVKENEEVQAM